MKTIQFNAAVEPATIAATVHWLNLWPLTVSLAPGEEKNISIEFRLDQEKFKTHDGVLAVKIFY